FMELLLLVHRGELPWRIGGGGWGAPAFFVFQSIPTFRNRWTIPRERSLPPGKTRFVILDLEREPSNRDQTSHLHRSIPQYRAARLGFHQRPAARQIRFVFLRSFAVHG